MAERERGRGKTEDDKIFKTNATFLIKMMRKLDGCSDTRVLVDELLHSIFFLGYLSDPNFLPQNLFDDINMAQEFMGRYPRPFTQYSLQLPRRSPFSCVLDMFVRMFGQQEENKIREEMKDLFSELKQGNKKKPLASSTICISQKTKPPDSNRYYGVSMSTSGRNPGQIMVAASCLSSWDSCVAGAVMTYYPVNIKNRFDGTIKLPEHVRCKTFRLSNGSEMPPCVACVNLFGIKRDEKEKEWAYGNCAEVESLSNLFKNDETVREEAKPTAEKTEKYKEEQKMAEKGVQDELIRLLRLVGKSDLAKKLENNRTQFSDHFYNPNEVCKRKWLNIKQ